MNVQDVIDDARSVWLCGTAPKFTAAQYDKAVVAMIEQRLARGLRKNMLRDARVLALTNARDRVTAEVQQ